jgi:hypothetical protein
MAALGVIVFAAAAGFAVVVVITVIVIIGVHQEERYMSLWDRKAPSAMALLARIVLGRYVRNQQRRVTGRDERNGSREHSTSSRS